MPTEHSHENEHIDDPQSGIVRASIFGVSDGLVSNLALVTGVAGGSADPSVVVLAGVAGLLAGAFSMAAGEYISMQTQREVLEHELALERDHIQKYPEEEQAHLTELLAGRGLDPEDAGRVAAQVHQNLEPAVDFHAMLELGIHPDSLGRPTGAAVMSFLSFGVGAAVPLAPWLVTRDGLVATVLLSSIALAAVGGLATRLTRRTVWWGAGRQLAVGLLAAAVTYWIGRAIGVAL